MTEDEIKRFPVGSRVKINRDLGLNEDLNTQTVFNHKKKSRGEWSLETQAANGNKYCWGMASSVTIVDNPFPKSTTEQWFDEKLSPKQDTKKEWQPDKGIDWEAHKGFMKGL